MLGLIFRSVDSAELLALRAQGQRRRESTCRICEPRRAIADTDDFVGARVRDRLTPKELKIVALIVQGFKNKEIANLLGTTEQVVKNYLRNVYDKIGVSDRLELALFTIHHRILAEAAAASAATMRTTTLQPRRQPFSRTPAPRRKRGPSAALFCASESRFSVSAARPARSPSAVH